HAKVVANGVSPGQLDVGIAYIDFERCGLPGQTEQCGCRRACAQGRGGCVEGPLLFHLHVSSLSSCVGKLLIQHRSRSNAAVVSLRTAAFTRSTREKSCTCQAGEADAP